MKQTKTKITAFAVILIILMCILAIFLSGCINTKNQFVDTDDTLDYTTFLKLLEANGFSFEEDEQKTPGYLSVSQNRVNIGKEQLVIYEYDSNEVMENDVKYIGKDGCSITRPDPDQDDLIQHIEISWVSNPYWFKRDLIIVNYVGTNKHIINFLHETFDLFAGHGYRNE
jgi:hypothetical protein